MIIGFIWICLLWLMPITVFGQNLNLKEGDRVKIKTTVPDMKKVTGTVYHLNASELYIHSSNQDYRIPVHSVRRAFVSQGRKRNSFKGMLIGGVSGGLLLGAAASFAYEKCDEELFCLYDDKTAIIISNTLAGALIGGGTGFIAGTFIKTDRWILVRRASGRSISFNQHTQLPVWSLSVSFRNRNS